MQFRKGVPQGEPLVLRTSVDELIGPDHMVRIIDQVVDTLDLSPVEATFHTTGVGAPAYPPKMLLKLFAYGYLTHRFSSRRISQACREDLGFMWLARLEQPKHSVLAAFRQRHVTDLPQWLAQLIARCVDLGMVGWQLGAVDGSKFQADASKHKAMSYGRMKEVITTLEAELETLVAAHGAADAQMPVSPTVSAQSTDPEEDVSHGGDRVHQACRTLQEQGAAEQPTPELPPSPPESQPAPPPPRPQARVDVGARHSGKFNGQRSGNTSERPTAGSIHRFQGGRACPRSEGETGSRSRPPRPCRSRSAGELAPPRTLSRDPSAATRPPRRLAHASRHRWRNASQPAPANAHPQDRATAPPPLPADHEERVRNRLHRVQHAAVALRERWAAEHPTDSEPPATAQWNFTDPESHIMVTKTQGVQQAYNTQVVVDAQEGVIVGIFVSDHSNDMEELGPALDAAATLGGGSFQQVLTDAGYFSADNVRDLADRHIDGYIAAGSDTWRTTQGQKLFGKGQFAYDQPTDTFECPAHHRLPHVADRKESVGGGQSRLVGVYRSDRATCGACELKAQCLTPKQSRKEITRGEDDAVRDAMKAKLRSPKGDALYRRRKGIAEPVFGILKETLGFRQWSLRGLKKVRGEFSLVTTAYDIRKIAKKIRRLGAEAPAWLIS